MENVLYLLMAVIAGAFGYSQYLKTQTTKGQADLEAKLESNKEKIAVMESEVNQAVTENNNEIAKLEAEKQKEVSGEELANFFNDLFNKSK
jgi:hypothetical protein